MPEITGSKLKQIREERHIPLENVAKATRIRLPLLQDLENEDYEDLGSRAQIRGFLKLYADFLGISLEETVPQNTAEESKPTTSLPLDEQLSNITPEAPLASEKKTLPATKSKNTEKPKSIKPQKRVKAPQKADKTEDFSTILPSSHSQQILDDIGRQLSARRKYLDIPWDLLVEQTHIPRPQLIALEQGNLDAFTSPAEAKGLLQTYARFLNLNTDLLLVQFADALQERLAEKSPAPRKSRKHAKLLSPRIVALKRFFTLDLFFGTLLVGGIIFFMIWGVANLINQTANEQEATSLPEIGEVLISSQTPLVLEATPTIEKTSSGFQLPTATPLAVPVDANAPIQVVINARQTVWMKVTADDKEVYQGRMTAGTVNAYTAENYVELEAGNAAALEIVFNQTPLDPFSRVGQTLRLRFDANGMQDLSSQPSYLQTPTLTPKP